MSKHKIGSCIATLRKEKGWTQAVLANKLQVSDKAISKWESNKGDPSLEFLPQLAELFNVTLDYLMTGKEVKERLATISKFELCAKNDDIDMLSNFIKDGQINYFGDNAKELIYNVFKYDSVNVFRDLMKKNNGSLINEWIYESNYIDKEEKDIRYKKLMRMLLLSDSLFLVKNINIRDKRVEDYNIIVHKDFLKDFEEKGVITLLDDEYFDVLITDERVPFQLKNKYFDIDNNLYYLSYPYLIDAAYRNKKSEDFDLLIKNLSEYIERYKKELQSFLNSENHYAIDDYIRKGRTGQHVSFNQNNFSFTYILKKTLKLALERSDYKTLEKMNSINEMLTENVRGKALYGENILLDENVINHHKISNNQKIGQTDKQILLCVYDGIIDIDKLIAIDDYSSYEKALKKYPASQAETIYNKFYEKDYKWLFNYFAENKNENILNCFRTKKLENLEKYITEHLKSKTKFSINEKYFTNLKDDNGRIVKLSHNDLLNCKEKIFLLEVLDKEINFIKKGIETANQKELDFALEKVAPNNFKAIKLLLDAGAVLHKRWSEDDGWGYNVNRDEIDLIGTELLKENIKKILEGK